MTTARRLHPDRFLLALALAATPSATAQMLWSQKAPPASPQARRFIEQGMAFDPARGRTLLCGGFDATAGIADTWEWDGATWTQRVVSPNPGRLYDHAMAHDVGRGRTVLFGGLRTGTGVVGETWEWDGTAWLRRAPVHNPSARTGHRMVYDPGRGQVLLFGGQGRTGDPPELNDLWAFDGTDWTAITPPASPARRTEAAMAFDTARGRVVLFGGFASTSGILGDTWEFDGSQWTQLASGSIPPRWHASMAFDAARRRVVLFGGLRGSPLADTWEWDGRGWQQMVLLGPGARHGAGLCADTTRGRLTLFGGGASTTDVKNDTWEYLPADVTPPVVTIQAPLDGAVVSQVQVALQATVADEGATTVSSAPAGITASLPMGGGPVTGTVTLAAGDGAQGITLSARDSAGNSGGRTVTVVLDTTAPVVDVAAPGEGLVLGASPALFRVVVQDLTATTVRFGPHTIPLPAGGGTATGDVPLVEGNNPITVVVTDAAGHDTVLVRSVRLDTTAPLVTITAPAAGARLGAAAAQLPVTAVVDDASATTVSSAPAGVAANLPPGGGLVAGVVALVEGHNLIRVTAQDGTGHQGSSVVDVWLDTQAPTVALDAPAPDALLRGVIEVAAMAQDSGLGVAQVALTVDGAPLALLTQEPFLATLDTRLLRDGSHLLEAVAQDVVGNRAAAQVRFQVDNTPPSLSFLAPVSGTPVRGTIALDVAAADGGSGLLSLTMTAGGLAPTSDGSLVLTAPVAALTRHGQEDTLRWGNGPLVLFARATDAAGNVAEVELTVRVDNALPPVPAIVPGDGAVVRGEITITANADGEDLRRIELFVDGVPVGNGARAPLSVRFDTRRRLDGAMAIRSVVTGSGDRTTDATVHVTVDNLQLRRVEPEALVLRVPPRPLPLRVVVAGVSVDLLRQLPAGQIELRVPGGAPVLAAPLPRAREHGGRGRASELELSFDRRALLLAITAGMAGGQIPRDSRSVTVTLWAAGQEIGSAPVRILAPQHHRCRR